jgi:hypothetical protein
VDHTVEDLLAPLDQLVGVDRKRRDVAVLNEGLGLLAGLSLIEKAVGVNTFVSSFQNRVTQHVGRIVVTVLPDERNGHLVLVLERLRHDGSTISALETSLGCPTAEVSLCCSHFDCLLPSIRLLVLSSFWSKALESVR